MALETPAAAATSLIPAKRTLPDSVDLQLAANVAESADLILQKYGSSALYGKELLDSGDEFLHFQADLPADPRLHGEGMIRGTTREHGLLP